MFTVLKTKFTTYDLYKRHVWIMEVNDMKGQATVECNNIP